MKQKRKILKTVSLAALALLAVMAICALVIAGLKPTPARDRVLLDVHYPIVLVDGHPLSLADLSGRYAVAQALAGGNKQTVLDGSAKQRAYDEMVSAEEIRQLAAAKGVRTSAQELDEEYKALSAQYQGGAFEDLLARYQISPQEFKHSVLKAELDAKNLNVWFNGQRALNSAAYKKADTLLYELQQGASFEGMVKDNTEDDSGKLTEGDLGFASANDILPEFRQTLSTAQPGDIKIIPSRYGLHIVKVADKITDSNGEASFHLWQIFIKTNDFNSWLSGQEKGFSVIRLARM